MTDYFAKVWDAADLLWTSFSFLERYYTIVAAVYLAGLIIKLIARKREPEILMVPVQVAPVVPPAA